MRYIILAIGILLSSPTLFAQNGVAEGEVPPAPPAKDVVPDSMLVNMVDKMPEFPGGKSALYRFLSNNLTYPDEARESGVQGKVFVEFVVCEDGSLCNERIISSFDKDCSKEVLRVISKMPAWKPAELHGRKVKTKYRLPVTFQLESYEPEGTRID